MSKPIAATASTFRRGLQVLALLRTSTSPLSILDIAQAVGMQRTTTYRFLDALLASGCVTRDDKTRRFSVSKQWAPPDMSSSALVDRTSQALKRISDLTGDSAFLICRSGTDSVCLRREVGSYPLQVLGVNIGHRPPLGVGAAGLAVLAALPPEESAQLIKQNASKLGIYGGMTADQLRLLVTATRTRGWSVVGNTAVLGALGVGVALCDQSGKPMLAVSVSSMIDRMTIARQKKIAAWIRQELADCV